MNTLTKLNKKNPSVICTSDRLSSIAIIDPTVPESDRIADGIKPDTETYILENKVNAITVFIQEFTLTLTFPSIQQPITEAFVLPTRSILSWAMLANW